MPSGRSNKRASTRSSRHGRAATFSTPVVLAFWAAAVGVTLIAVFAQDGLAMRLALAGSLGLAYVVWSVYSPALRAARLDVQHERTLHAKAVGAAADELRTKDREIATLQRRVARLEGDLAVARAEASAALAAVEESALERSTDGDSDDLWPDLSEAPTVVQIANRREQKVATAVREAPARTGTA